MSDIERLSKEQDSIREIAARIRDVCSQPEPPERASLSALRWELARTLMRHLPMKDRMVYARLRLHPDPAVAALGARYAKEASELFDGFQAHTEHWTPQAVDADWATYRAGMVKMVAILEDRIKREEAELLPHLETAPQVSVERRHGDRNWAHAGWRIREVLGLDSASTKSAA